MTIEYQCAQSANNVQAGLEGSLADTIKDSVYSLAISKLADFLLEDSVVIVNEDNMFSTSSFGQSYLLVSRDCTNNMGTKEAGQLSSKETNTTSGGMDNNPITLLDGVTLADHPDGCEALQEACCSLRPMELQKQKFCQDQLVPEQIQ
jgi:hypothetical protein